MQADQRRADDKNPGSGLALYTHTHVRAPHTHIHSLPDTQNASPVKQRHCFLPLEHSEQQQRLWFCNHHSVMERAISWTSGVLASKPSSVTPSKSLLLSDLSFPICKMRGWTRSFLRPLPVLTSLIPEQRLKPEASSSNTTDGQTCGGYLVLRHATLKDFFIGCHHC